MSLATGRFLSPKTEVEEIALLFETVNENNTKWAVNVFTTWQNTRMNKNAQLETLGGNGLERTDVSPTRAHAFSLYVYLIYTTTP